MMVSFRVFAPLDNKASKKHSHSFQKASRIHPRSGGKNPDDFCYGKRANSASGPFWRKREGENNINPPECWECQYNDPQMWKVLADSLYKTDSDWEKITTSQFASLNS